MAPRAFRLGRFEIIARDLTEDSRPNGPRTKKVTTRVGTSWHMRWRSDGNLRIISSSEALTSKRNAERAVAASPGVAEVIQETDQMWAVLIDGSRRKILVLDERDPELAK